MALAKSQKSLKDWTKQKWTTSDGKPSKGKKRYLPEKAWAALSPAEKAATNKAKAAGNAKGKQFVKQPKSIAKKQQSTDRDTGDYEQKRFYCTSMVRQWNGRRQVYARRNRCYVKVWRRICYITKKPGQSNC